MWLWALLVAAPTNGPLRVADNSIWLADAAGRGVLLAGIHDGWELQDLAWGDEGDVRFDWPGFLAEAADLGHNFLRLWMVEHTKIVDADTTITDPMPYRRVAGGPPARDGLARFDLDQFDPAYFDRLRQRAGEARERGLYVAVMLFQGWSVEDKGGRVNPWPYHPFAAGNNVNGVDADLDGDGRGLEWHSWLGEEHPLTVRRRAYLRRVVEAVADLDNVLFEVCNEGHNGSLEWQQRVVDYVRSIDPLHRLCGISVPYSPGRSPAMNTELLAANADWIAPLRNAPGGYNYRDNPPPADGTKVIISDTDHLWGVDCRDAHWPWRSFTRGLHPWYMDAWSLEHDDPARQSIRRRLGVIRRLAERLDLLALRPDEALSTTRFALASPHELVVYQPAPGPFEVDLPAGRWRIVYLHPETGAETAGGELDGGRRTLLAPWDGEVVAHGTIIGRPVVDQ